MFMIRRVYIIHNEKKRVLNDVKQVKQHKDKDQ